MRAVTTGPRTGTDWVILDGLTAGETIIVEGVQKVRGGSKVSPRPYVPPTPVPTAVPPTAVPLPGA